jgi:2-keto-3-deoxy-6-phosphogluconate aldolase
VTSSAMATILADRALAVVRAPEIPDPAALANVPAKSGIRVVELTFTTPRVLDHLLAATTSEAVLGVGTVLTADQALVRPSTWALNSLSHRGFEQASQKSPRTTGSR